MVGKQISAISLKVISLCLIQAIFVSLVNGQAEHEIHLNSIRNAPFKQKIDGFSIGDSAFIEFVIDNVLERPQDVMFISNRDLLTPLCVKHCALDKVAIYDTLKDNRIIDVHIEAKEFIAEDHTFTYFEGEDSLIESIDSLPAYGGTFNVPLVYLDTMTVSIGGKEIPVPREAYADLYNPNFCNNELFRQSV